MNFRGISSIRKEEEEEWLGKEMEVDCWGHKSKDQRLSELKSSMR